MAINVSTKSVTLERLRAAALKAGGAVPLKKNDARYVVIPIEDLGKEVASKIMSDYFKGLR